jgi:hypothetical protein
MGREDVSFILQRMPEQTYSVGEYFVTYITQEQNNLKGGYVPQSIPEQHKNNHNWVS